MKTENSSRDLKRKKIISCTGGVIALVFYIISCIMVARNNAVAKASARGDDSGVQTITIAHWQLEDGFREGVDYAIKEFEKLKAQEGKRVKVIQSTVPVRGYSQWYITQLISGNPADIIELSHSQELQSRYFLPLSNVIAKPNPFNKGTFAENIPWKDTFIDGMDSSINEVLSEYYGIGIFRHVTRLYVNLDLLKAATGSEEMPKTFDQWLECCRKLEEYGQKVGRRIIPIGVRGIDKSTVSALFHRYFAQFNSDQNDKFAIFGDALLTTQEKIIAMGKGETDMKRMLIPVRMVRDIGKYFSEGFTTTDETQTKFLFFTGNVAFFMEGTWSAWTLVNNTPFKVAIATVPYVSSDSKYYDAFIGRCYESNVGVSGRFGVARASRNQELALEFLQFLTSWKMNQKTMMEFCRWPTVVINSEYKGFLESMKPDKGDSRRSIAPAFFFSSKSQTSMLETLEKIIITQSQEPEKDFLENFRKNIPVMRTEIKALSDSQERQFFDIEGSRNIINAELLNDNTPTEKHLNARFRMAMTLENVVNRHRLYRVTKKSFSALEDVEKDLDNYTGKNIGNAIYGN